MIQYLIERELAFQPHLKTYRYTFIGPVRHMQDFIRLVHKQNPEAAVQTDLNLSLRKKDYINQGLSRLPAGTQLTIYVAHDNNNVHIWIPAWEITDYCKTRGIDVKL